MGRWYRIATAAVVALAAGGAGGCSLSSEGRTPLKTHTITFDGTGGGTPLPADASDASDAPSRADAVADRATAACGNGVLNGDEQCDDGHEQRP